VKLEVFNDADAVALAAATMIAAEARASIASRGRFALAVSGGHTPWVMLRALADEDVPWEGMQIFQVDERVAPNGHPDRNLTHLRESLFQHVPLRAEQVHAMPVEATDLRAAANEYASALREISGSPPQLDLVTFSTINRARRVLWVVTGNEKVQMLRRLIQGDLSIPAGRVYREHALLMADHAAAKDVLAGA
jgi:6-phosphogluconolactonase